MTKIRFNSIVKASVFGLFMLGGLGLTGIGLAANLNQPEEQTELHAGTPEVQDNKSDTSLVESPTKTIDTQRAREYRQLASGASVESRPGVVQCANLIYGDNNTSVCFADAFLAQAEKDTNIRTNRRFHPVKMQSAELALYPFSVMTGDGAFKLTEAQRASMKRYLENGGFIIASASCSSPSWNESFRGEVAKAFPDTTMKKLASDHPMFTTVYDLSSSKSQRGSHQGFFGLELDGRIVMIFSPDGLNDTSNAGPHCCCCGGNEIRTARQFNVNILAYALTH